MRQICVKFTNVNVTNLQTQQTSIDDRHFIMTAVVVTVACNVCPVSQAGQLIDHKQVHSTASVHQKSQVRVTVA